MVAHGSRPGLFIWDIKTRKKIKETSLKGQRSITALAFSPDDRFLVYGNKRGKLFVWDTNLNNVSLLAHKQHKGNIHDISFSDSGRFFATSGGQGILILWNFWTQEPVFKRFFPGPVLKAKFTQDKSLTIMVEGEKLFFIKLKLEPNRTNDEVLTLPETPQKIFENAKKSVHFDAIVKPPLAISASARFIAYTIPILLKTTVWDRHKKTTKTLTYFRKKSPILYRWGMNCENKVFSDCW